jgi:hypothetical protein
MVDQIPVEEKILPLSVVDARPSSGWIGRSEGSLVERWTIIERAGALSRMEPCNGRAFFMKGTGSPHCGRDDRHRSWIATSKDDYSL